MKPSPCIPLPADVAPPSVELRHEPGHEPEPGALTRALARLLIAARRRRLAERREGGAGA